MQTPYFPSFRSRLAALGQRTAHTIRQATLSQLQEHLRDLLPASLLSATDEGPNSRERIFSLRLTFECFVWQVLKPKTSCREVVRQVQALFRLHHELWQALKKGDILLGDRAFGEFTCLAALPNLLGVDVVARLHQCRKADFRKAQRLSKHDGLFVWSKGWQQSEVLSASEWGL